MNGKRLCRHMLMRLADNRWFWYQRYHHMLVDGCSFTAIASALLRYIPTFAGQRDVLLYDAPLPTDHAAVVVTGPKPDHVAYIIFTSSSTGRPKGGG